MLQSLTLRRTKVESRQTGMAIQLFLRLFESVIITVNRPIDLFLINIYNFFRNGGLEFGVSVGPELISASLLCVDSRKAEQAFTF